MLSKENIEIKVRGIIIDKAGTLEIDDISVNTKLYDDLGMDSLDVTEVIVALEFVYGIVISEEKRNTFKSIGDVVNCVEGLLNNNITNYVTEIDKLAKYMADKIGHGMREKCLDHAKYAIEYFKENYKM